MRVNQNSNAMSASTIPKLTIQAHIAELQLQRPLQHNRLQADDLLCLEAQLKSLAENDAVHVLLLTANGASFCAGFDLRALSSGNALQDPQLLERVINAFEALPQPTIAVLQGDMHGGGIDLALACDFRIAANHIRAHMPAARLGVHYYAHGMRRYVQRLGANAARRLLLAGETFDTAQLQHYGFIDAAYSAGELSAQAKRYAERLRDSPPHIVQGMKRDLREIENGRFDEVGINSRWQRSLNEIAKRSTESKETS